MRHGCAKAFFEAGRDAPLRRPRADKKVPDGPVTDFQAVCLFEMRSDLGPHLTGSTQLTNLLKVIPQRALKRLGMHRGWFRVVSASSAENQIDAKQMTVTVSRAREQLRIYTDSTAVLREAATRSGDRESATEHTRQAQGKQPQKEPEIEPDLQEQLQAARLERKFKRPS